MSDAARPVLVVEDEPKIAEALVDYLRAAGFAPHWIADGAQALEYLRNPPPGQAPSALLLDIMLPGMDGMAVCREVRRFSAVPILMVTARIDEFDRVLGLELGADDYVCKPFHPREVVARVRALVRRAEGRLAGLPAAPLPGAGGFAIDEAGMRIYWNGQPVPLTPVEFRLLRALLMQPGRVFERGDLLDALHEDFRDVSDRVVDSHVKNLRRKLEAMMPGQRCIGAVYGVGYRFDPPTP